MALNTFLNWLYSYKKNECPGRVLFKSFSICYSYGLSAFFSTLYLSFTTNPSTYKDAIHKFHLFVDRAPVLSIRENSQGYFYLNSKALFRSIISI